MRDTWVFLLFVGVAMFLRLLGAAANRANKSQQNKQPPPPPRVAAGADETDAERMRKFLEALGAPPGSAPPRRVEPRTQVPPRPLAPVQPPREMAPPLVRRGQPKQAPRRTTQPPPLPVQPFEVHRPAEAAPPSPPRTVTREDVEIAFAQTPSPHPRRNMVDLLRSPEGLRDAVILREIFGPPRAFETGEYSV